MLCRGSPLANAGMHRVPRLPRAATRPRGKPSSRMHETIFLSVWWWLSKLHPCLGIHQTGDVDSDACKAAQYCGYGSTGCIFVARVLLGHPCEAEGPMRTHLDKLLGPTRRVLGGGTPPHPTSPRPIPFPNHFHTTPKPSPNQYQTTPKPFPNHSQTIPKLLPNHSQTNPKLPPNHSHTNPKPFPDLSHTTSKPLPNYWRPR